MISKIKEMVNLTEKLDELNKKLLENSEQINQLNEKVNSFNNNLTQAHESTKNLNTEHNKFKSDFQTNKDSVENNNIRFKELLNEFSMLKSSLPEKLFNQLDQELKPHLARIKTESKQFDNLNHDLTLITGELANIRKEIGNFKDIASKIKKEDFQLTGYAKKLEQEDRNKLKLLKEIDDLKRIIAKERSKNRKPY